MNEQRFPGGPGEAPPLPPRRSFLARALGLGAGALSLIGRGRPAEAQTTGSASDLAILNFALNFEYLGAEYYAYGLTGQSSSASGVGFTGSGTAGATTVKASPKVTFATPTYSQLIAEFSRDEQAHANFLRTLIYNLGGQAIAKPAIDLLNSFNTAARMLGMASFDPFANETNFMLGAFMLEDVCVTALNGAAPLIQSKSILNGAAGFLGTEAYQAGAIRSLLYERGQGAMTHAIATLRATASGVGDYGVADGPLYQGPSGNSSIVLADMNALAFARTPRQVLNIAYLAPNAASGGFFPNGVNGTLKG